MILKKPYAFIIKHFRLIHLLLLAPMCYLLLKSNEIRIFFREYVINNYSIRGTFFTNSLSANYINIVMYLAIIVILFVFILMIILFQRKDKPTKFYSISVVYYLVLFALLTISYSIFNGIEADTISQGTINIIKDTSLIIYYSEYIFVFMTLLRGVGFDIKRFNFKSDIKELQIDSADSEEFEFILDKDNYKTKRNIRRFFSEFKYYYLENKFIFTIIFIFLIIFVGTIIFRSNNDISKKVFHEGESVSLGYLNVSINDSFVSSLNSRGKNINEDKAYIILKLNITNRNYEDQSLNYANLVLKIGNMTIGPNLALGNEFYIYGIPYVGDKIKGSEESKYILVYEIDKKMIGQKININAYASQNYFYNIELSPEYVSDNISISKINKGTNINLASIENSTVSIQNYEVMNRFAYTYNYCSSVNNCYDLNNYVSINPVTERDKTLMVLDYSIYLDSDSYYMEQSKTYRTFFSDFLEIKYTINGTEYTDQAVVSNPNDYNDKLILKVSNKIKDAKEIEAVINNLNNSYVIKLK